MKRALWWYGCHYGSPCKAAMVSVVYPADDQRTSMWEIWRSATASIRLPRDTGLMSVAMPESSSVRSAARERHEREMAWMAHNIQPYANHLLLCMKRVQHQPMPQCKLQR
jgi:hypothetical protein